MHAKRVKVGPAQGSKGKDYKAGPEKAAVGLKTLEMLIEKFGKNAFYELAHVLLKDGRNEVKGRVIEALSGWEDSRVPKLFAEAFEREMGNPEIALLLMEKMELLSNDKEETRKKVTGALLGCKDPRAAELFTEVLKREMDNPEVALPLMDKIVLFGYVKARRVLREVEDQSKSDEVSGRAGMAQVVLTQMTDEKTASSDRGAGAYDDDIEIIVDE